MLKHFVCVLRKLLENPYRRNFLFSVVLISGAILLMYANIITGDFVYDDKNFITENWPVKKWLFTHPWDFFLKPEVAVWSGIYRPLRTFSFAIDYQFFGLNPAGYHIENLLLHLANCILLYIFLQRMLKSNAASLLSSLLFAVHPVQIEAVTWISSRADLMFSSIVLICMVWFAQASRSGPVRFSTSIIFGMLFFCALLSKETAIGLIPVLCIYDICFNFRPNRSKLNFYSFFSSRILFYCVLIAVSIIYIIIRFSLFENISQKPFWGGSAKANFLTMLDATVYYFRLIFYPTHLCVDYSTYPITGSFFSPYLMVAAVFYALVAGICIIEARRKNFRFFFFCSIFVFFLLPSWNIIPISAIIAERFLYFPMIGFCALAGISLDKIRTKNFLIPHGKTIALCALGCVLIALVTGGIYRNFYWHNEFRLWKSCVTEFPGNFKGHINLGTCYDSQGNDMAALTEYYKLLSIRPHHATAYYNLGNIYWKYGLFEKSRQAFLTALKLQPDYWQALNNLGSLYIDKMWFDEARTCFLKIIEKNPAYARAHYNLGMLYYEHYKQYDNALYHFLQCINDDEFRGSLRVRSIIEELKKRKHPE